MAQKNAQSLKLFAVIAVLALLVVGGAYAMMQWQANREPTPPQEVMVTASVGDQELETAPYMVCEPGVECPEGEVPSLRVSAGDTVTITVPEEVYDHDWQLLTIYDEPGANDQQLHSSYDADSIDVPVSAEPVGDSTTRPELVVVEVSSVMIGTDDAGEETPYLTTWAFSFEVN